MVSASTTTRKNELTTRLSSSLARAKSTFFMPGAEYELNISADDRDPVLSSTESRSHPLPPDQLAPINKEVDRVLYDSLHRFLTWSHENSGTAWLTFTLILGIVLALTAFIPLAVGLCEGQTSRYLRLLGWIPLHVGFVMIYAAFSKVTCFANFVISALTQYADIGLPASLLYWRCAPTTLFRTRSTLDRRVRSG